MSTQTLSTSNMESMMTSTTQTLVRRGTEMKQEILRENTMSTFLMEGSNM